MPELPEVETLCRQLNQVILDTGLQHLTILDAKLENIGNVPLSRIHSVNRQGKFLLIGLDGNRTLYLHLRMSGRLVWQRHQDILPAHSRFVMTFRQGKLVCVDPRRFATLSLEDRKDRTSPIPDPLQSFSATILHEIAHSRQTPVKSFLLNQSLIAGIGNIYACEILHKSGINPRRRTDSLSLSEWRRVAWAGRAVLCRATECRGTSISDWRDLYGQKGEYQHHLAVYGRAGLPCHRCGGKIQRITLSGRGTYFCDQCQQ